MYYPYMQNSTFILEKDFAAKGFTHIIGTDEVGRGPLCGPVLACAAMFKDINFEISADKQKQFDLIRDSKKVSEKQREEVFDFICENFYIGIGLCDHETIDRINILEASFLSMKKAIQELKRNMGKEIWGNVEPRYVVLVDGNKQIPNLSMEQYAVVGGDKLVKSISAASIVAKVTRDRMMQEFHLKYPQYGLDKHKGYGTKMHMAALSKYGPCEIHRKSFAPVKKAINELLAVGFDPSLR
ncbi:MAG: Ribonuclease HII [Candidatus Moranbacteria bacterium GW2011_GWE1_36_7]|nr:MAG: Ribonuclease HII [Candidatus Moranbacteria bacterium GW2011_GWD2_36_12]KKQ07055.1 MAG: Ribonuclease HII [Candidatus Moranbacteria bacterium GW2011_GWE2_36_40]KKQ11994.1 MAG: Ribonuclease HII [Candidatus Moranbacteria bacterium GW2011_GWE1_36_7]